MYDANDLRLLGIGLNEVEKEQVQMRPVVLHPPAYDRLFRHGISGAGISGYDPFDALCVDQVCFLEGNRFEFRRYLRDDEGHRTVIVIPAANEIGDLDDLVAWKPGSDLIGTWLGRASLLGADNLFVPRLDGPLIIHESVEDWLRSGRQGVFIIDPKRAAPLLHLAGTLGVRRHEFGRRLARALTIQAPHIVVDVVSREAA